MRNNLESYTGRETYPNPTRKSAFRAIEEENKLAGLGSEASLKREMGEVAVMRRQGIISKSEEGLRMAGLRKELALANGQPEVMQKKRNPQHWKGGGK